MLLASEAKNRPGTIGDTPVYREDEGADAAWQRVEVVEKGADLIEGVLIAYVAGGLGFGDEKVRTRTGAAANDVGPVTAN